MCWTHWNALYKGISVVLAYYDKIKNFMKKNMPKCTPKVSPKSRFGRSGVRLLRFWEGFWGVGIFMSFQSAKSRLKIDKVGGLGRPPGECAQILGRVGGQGGGHRRLLESDRNWQESDNAFRTPCTPKGGGGSECAMRREHRRPRICRSAFGAAVCILQPANYRSVFCWLFCLRLMLAYCCSYLNVLGVFRYFITCHAAVTFCKCSCRNVTTIFET